ncbi:uncharacterized protein LOC129230420 [Uloborus diversus]|uniref:uncharacterized protein LOC129230420 n=1 Tax=Uloborus diversus TaxID=327109 RepID=UPI002409F788|nr:uncharacterized protein LOC129230420 [Uloborus diversus]
MTDLNILNRRRGGLKGQVMRLLSSIGSDIDAMDSTEIGCKVEHVQALKTKFEQLKLDYYSVLKDEELDENEEIFIDLEEELEKIEVALKRKFKQLNNNISRSFNDAPPNSTISIRLPEISLPKFNGKYEEWFLFKEQFNSIINSNSSLSDSQKLYYLKSSLIGRAKEIETIDDTYQSLWKALTERFENKRLIVNSHIQELLNIQKITHESADELRNLVDKIHKHLRALRQMDLQCAPIEFIALSDDSCLLLLAGKLDEVFLCHIPTKETVWFSNMVAEKIDLSERFPASKVQDGFLMYGETVSVGLAIKMQTSFKPPDRDDDDNGDGGDNENDDGPGDDNDDGDRNSYDSEFNLKVDDSNILLSSDNGLSYNVFELRSFPSFEKIYTMNMSTYVQLIDCKPNQFHAVDTHLATSSYVARRIFPPLVKECRPSVIHSSHCRRISALNALFTDKSNGCKTFVMPPGITANVADRALHFSFTLSSSSNQSEYFNVKSMYETSLASRLQSLIQRKKFLEAETFAINSHLDFEVIHKTKIVCLLADLSSTEKNLSNIELNNIWNDISLSLEKIQDLDFIAQKLQITLPDIHLMEKWLSIVKTWVNKSLNKLVTFQLLEASFSLSMTLKDFLSKNLLEYILSQLAVGHLKKALLVWKCHKNELLSSLTEDDVMNILEKVPYNLTSNFLMQFLEEDLFPVVFLRLPSVIDNVAEWLIRRVKLLEMDEKKKRIDPTSSIGALSALSQNLELLTKLKKDFSCTVPSAYFEESKMDLIFAVLDTINLPLLCDAVKSFVQPYTLENELNLDFCLENYIEYAVQSAFSVWSSNVEESWEDRWIEVINCIGDPNMWNKAALVILDKATVPWSDKVRNLLKQGLVSGNPKREDFEVQATRNAVKEILKKYEIKDLKIDQDVCDPEMVVKYIFRKNWPSAFDDAKKIICSYRGCPDAEIHFKYLQYFLISNKLDEMIEMLSTLAIDDAVECCNRLMSYLSCCLEDKYLVKNDTHSIEVMIDASIYIAHFLKRNKKSVDEEMLIFLRCLRKLQVKFQMFLTLTEFSNKLYVERFLETYIHSSLEIVQKEEAKVNDERSDLFSTAVVKISRLSDALLVPREKMVSMLIFICLEKKKYNCVLMLCRDLIVSYPSERNAETLMEVVEHFFTNFSSLENISFDVMIETICHLTSTAVTYSDEKLIKPFLYAVNLCAYFSTIKKIIGQQASLPSTAFTVDSYDTWKFSPMYNDKGFQLERKTIVEAVTNIMPLLFMERNHSDNAIVASMDGMFQIGRQLYVHMMERGHEIAALNTLLMYYQLFLKVTEGSANVSDAFELIYNDVENVVFSILQKIVSQRNVDIHYALSLLTLLPEKNRIISLKKLLKWCATKLHCLRAIGKIGSEFGALYHDSDLSTEYGRIYKKASILLMHNMKFVSADQILDSTNKDYGWQIVKEIMSPNVDLSSIYECCEAFDLPTNYVLVTFLNNLLSEIDRSTLNCTELNESDVAEPLRTAKCILQNIKDEDLVLSSLQNLLKMISPYSYEILLFVYHELLKVSANVTTVDSESIEKGIIILKFLKVYKRRSPPTESELQQWLAIHPTAFNLPALSKTRMSFGSLMHGKVHTIINPELAPQTLMLWLELAKWLELSEDELKMIAIKNLVSNYLAKHSGTNVALSEDLVLLDTINNLMQKINNPKLATVCANWIANMMPKGANCVTFSNLAVKYAQIWLNQSPMDSSAASSLKNLLRRRQRAAIERILFSSNFSSERILTCAHDPRQLIEYLLEEYCASVNSSMKVCKVAFDIAEETKIDLTAIFSKFFFNWLSFSPCDSNLDESILGSPTIQIIEDSSDDNQNLLKAMFLLLGIPSEFYPRISEAAAKELKNLSASQQGRLLFCLASVFGNKVAAQFLNIESKILDDYLIPFMCASYLESLRIICPVEMFLKCSKVELIQQILSTHSNSSKALLFCVKLCLEYNIWTSEIWEVILQRMTAMSMDKALEGILVTYQDKIMNLWHSKAFISAWKCVVNGVFKMDNVDASNLISRIYKALLQCPCTTSLDIESLWTEIKFSLQTSSDINLDELKPKSDVCSLIEALEILLENK